MPDHASPAPDTPDTPPPDPEQARAALHEWIDALDDEVLLALWTLVYWCTRPVDRRERD